MATPYSIQSAEDIDKLSDQELAAVRDYVGNLYATGGEGISGSELAGLQGRASELGISQNMIDDLILAAYQGYGGENYDLGDVSDLIYGGQTLAQINPNTQQQQKQQQQQQQQQSGTDYQGTITGGSGVDFKGSSGLREFYGPYVTDYLSRMSGLLALRDAPDYQPVKFGTAEKGGTYGADTAKTLADLQAKREAMMSGDQAYKPYQYSFVQKPMTTKPAAKGGIMSLVDHYDAGGAVGNVADTVVGGTNTGTPTYANQTVPSTYTAPTNTYTGPGATGITTGSFDPDAISRFTNPYATAVTDPQVREAKRQAELARQSQAAKFSQAGAFGGSRSILAENELGRNLATQIGDIYGKGQKEAYDAALRAFEAEEGRKLTAGVETERARQEAGRQGLTGAATEAQYQQQARELQQRAEEAAARGDQFEANLALQQLAEANRAAESARQFEYTQARDTYLDPFREILYANQALGGLPIQAGATGISPMTESIVSMLGLSNVLSGGNTRASDRRLKTDIQAVGVLDNGLKVYSYRYKSGGPVHIGVMADEVAVLRPQAYIKGGAGDGFDAVDYSKL